VRRDSAPSASANPRAVAPGCSRPPVAPQGALRCESGAPAARGLKPRRGAILAPIRTSRPVGGVYGRSGLRPGTETVGASAEARVKGAFGPRLKPGRPPTVFMRRRIKAGYLTFLARSERPTRWGKLSGGLFRVSHGSRHAPGPR